MAKRRSSTATKAPPGKAGTKKSAAANKAATTKAGTKKSPPTKSAAQKVAPTKSAAEKSAPKKSASTKSAPTKSAPEKSAPTKSASTKSAPEKSAPPTSAAQKVAPTSPAVSALLDRVRAINWETVSRGQAGGFPAVFASLVAPGAASTKALASLRQLLVRGDGFVFPVAGLAMPFLVELLGMAEPFDRAAVLTFVADTAMSGHVDWIERGFDPATTATGFLASRSRARTYQAFVRGESAYLASLDDPDPAVRAAAAFALAWIQPSAATGVRETLRAALEREPDPIVRASTILAIATVSRTALDRSDVAGQLDARLASDDPTERMAAAIACSLLPEAASDPTVPKILATSQAKKVPNLPWVGGDLHVLAERRLLMLVFGEPPAERPATAPILDEKRRATLRSILDSGTYSRVRGFFYAHGMPDSDHVLRRYAGMPRELPNGPHAPIYDRWLTWAETGTPDASALAATLAAEVAAADIVKIAELMYYVEQDHEQQHADWPLPQLADQVPPPNPEDNSDTPGDVFRYNVGDLDELVRRYQQVLTAQGFETWSHGDDGPNDLNDGDVVAWHRDGREIRAGFDRSGGVVRVNYEWYRSLLPAFVRAACVAHGEASLLESLHAIAMSRTGNVLRRAIGLLRIGWAIADHTGTPPDPICDYLAYEIGAEKSYIFWPLRVHFDRLPEDRREALIVRLLSPGCEGALFGYVRFCRTEAVEAAARKLVSRALRAAYDDLRDAHKFVDQLMPFVDDRLVPTLTKRVKADDYPVIPTLLLARLGHLDAIQPALKSAWTTAREAAKLEIAGGKR